MSATHVLDRLRAHKEIRPHASALEHDGIVEFTYASLADAVGGLAERLQAAGVSCEGRVALHLPRSPQWVVAALGTWMAGGAVFPLDPSLPLARRSELVRLSQPTAVVGEPWQDLPHVPVAGPSGTLLGDVAPHALAWLIFSSGSTGKPKGVLVEHRAYGAVLADQVAALRLTWTDRVAWLLSPQFDASLSDIGVSIWAGATLCTDSRHLLESLPDLQFFLTRQNITYADLPPRLLDIFDPCELPELRVVLCGGEPLPPAGARKWARAKSLIGVYGPTEATICTSLWHVCPEDVDDALIGHPIGGALLHVENEELWIGGPGVARGYLNDPELTTERFVVDAARVRWHRTGDRVKARADGSLVFVGRVDRQCKVDGRLTCPEEVEKALVEIPGVAAAAVIVKEINGVNVLHAYVETIGGTTLSSTHCVEHLNAVLPVWMIPHRWNFGILPRTTTGKVDISSLRNGSICNPSSDSLVPQDPLAGLIARIIGDGKYVSETQSLASMGLDSLRTLQLCAALTAAGMHISPQQVRTAGNIERIRMIVASRESASVCADELIAAAKRIADKVSKGAQSASAKNEACAGTMLLTGATGGLGCRVLACLLSRGLSVLALVRAPNEPAARARIGESFGRYDLYSELLKSPRLSIVCGDLSSLSPDGKGILGDILERASWSGLMHLAADLNLTADAETLWQTNVDATAGLLSLVIRRGGTPILFASTLSVFVDTDLDMQDFTEDMAAPSGVNVMGGYAQTKFAAEVLVETAAPLPRLVVRYGLLTGDRNNGRSAPTDWFAKIIRGLKYLGALPPVDRQRTLAFDVTPTDQAAEATVDMWQRLVAGVSLPARVHIAAPAPSTIHDLARAFEVEGHPLQFLSEHDFVQRVSEAVSVAGHVDEAAAMLAFANLLSFGRASAGSLHALNLFRATCVRFGGTETTHALGRPSVTPTTLEQLCCLLRAALE